MKPIALLIALLLPAAALAAQTVHLKLEGGTEAQAMESAKKGYDYLKARNAQAVSPRPASSSSTDKRKQSLYFPESVSGYYLSPDNEVLHIQRGKVVKRMKVRPTVKKRAVPEVDDEVLVRKKADKKKSSER